MGKGVGGRGKAGRRWGKEKIGGGGGEKHFSRVVEGDLPCSHAGVLFEVRPGGVDDGDVVFFVACPGFASAGGFLDGSSRLEDGERDGGRGGGLGRGSWGKGGLTLD